METLRGSVLALKLERPVICGHSFGGAVALACAMAQGNEIAGAVALAPICFPEPRLEQALFGPRAIPVLSDVLSSALSVVVDPALLPALWRAMFLPEAMPAAFAAGFPFARAARPAQLVAENAASHWPDLAPSACRYASCRAPARMLCGTADLVVNGLFQAAPAAALIPVARLGWLLSAGHMLHQSHQGAVAEAVAELTRDRA